MGSSRRPLAPDRAGALPRGSGRSYRRLRRPRSQAVFSIPARLRRVWREAFLHSAGRWAAEPPRVAGRSLLLTLRRRAAQPSSDGRSVGAIKVAAALSRAPYFAFRSSCLGFEAARPRCARLRRAETPMAAGRSSVLMRGYSTSGGEVAGRWRRAAQLVPNNAASGRIRVAGLRSWALYSAFLISCVGFEAARCSIPRDAGSLCTRWPRGAPAH